MKEFSTELFFEIEGTLCQDLFKKSEKVWEPLLFLEAYLERSLLGKIEVEIPSSTHLEKKELISIGKGTKIEPGAYISGPCIIGEDCEIRHGAYIRGNVILGHRCIVGHATEIKHSIVLNQTVLAHFNYVGDSILGSGVNLGAGAVCANLRLDRKFITVSYQKIKMATQLKKFGAIIGDNSQIGCHCVTNPGTVIGKGVITYPCLNLSGYIPSFSIAKPPFKPVIY